jgi:hypothetical protein
LAPVLNFQIRAGGIIGANPFYKKILRINPLMMNQRLRLFFELRKRGDHVRKLHLELIAHYKVNAFNASKLFETGLGVASGYRHKGLWGMTEDLANDASAIHLGPFGDCTGINHEDIRFPAKFHRDKPVPLKSVCENGRFSLIEPTP